MSEQPTFEPKDIGQTEQEGYDAVLGAGDGAEATPEPLNADYVIPGMSAVDESSEAGGYPPSVDANGDHIIEIVPSDGEPRSLKPGDIGYNPDVDDHPNPSVIQ